MLAEIGEIVLQVDDNDYQGDTRVLYKDGDRYGHLCFGWGSCSGCDALQACDNLQEVQKLFESLVTQVKWFDSKTDALAWFKGHDWEGDYSWHTEEQKEYLQKAITILSTN